MFEAETQLRQTQQLAERGYVGESEVESSRRQLDVIREAYATQIRLLQIELQEAQLAYKAATQHLDRLKKLYEAKAASVSELAEAQHRADGAKLSVERAKTLLDLYRKVDPTDPPQEQPAREEG